MRRIAAVILGTGALLMLTTTTAAADGIGGVGANVLNVGTTILSGIGVLG
jgi:hypothetical protein